MSTSKQRRQAAQRHLQRQLERRAELMRKRRRNLAILATSLAVVVVVGAALLITGVFSSDDKTAAADPSASSTGATAVSTNPDGTVSCVYRKDTSGNKSLKEVGTPPNATSTPTTGTSVLKMATNQGNLTLTLDRSKAPCAAASFTYLASKKFFDNSVCHREVNQPSFGVLQCGDPTGTGSGGPTYIYPEEIPKGTKYPRGTIAMANAGPGTTGSQFFLCFTNADLPADYTPVGTVDAAGLAVLDKIAKAGNDGSYEPSPGGGKPKTPVKISSISVVS